MSFTATTRCLVQLFLGELAFRYSLRGLFARILVLLLCVLSEPLSQNYNWGVQISPRCLLQIFLGELLLVVFRRFYGFLILLDCLFLVFCHGYFRPELVS